MVGLEPANGRRCLAALHFRTIRFPAPSYAFIAIALCCGGDPVGAAGEHNARVAGQTASVEFSDHLLDPARELTSEDGTITLSWTPSVQGAIVELEQSPDTDFTSSTIRYEGADPGSVITGLPEGTHFFRIRAIETADRPGPWSDPLKVTVTFMDRGALLLLLSLGGSVVVLTVGAILAGHVRTRGEP